MPHSADSSSLKLQREASELLIAAQLGELNHDEDFAHQQPVVHATASTSRTSKAKYREFVTAKPESLRQNSMKGLAEMRPKGLRVAEEMTGELCAMIEPFEGRRSRGKDGSG
jgi:hypothetical protein